MRQLLFRGQTCLNGEKVKLNGKKLPSNWAYGGVFQGEGSFSVIYGVSDPSLEEPFFKHTVYSSTVGQYIGIDDIHGKKIFEDDVVRRFNEFNEYIDTILVYWEEDMHCFAGIQVDGDHRFVNFMNPYFEIVGNCFDNPEYNPENWEV